MTGFDSKRKVAQDKLDDEPDTLLIVYQRGFSDGKAAAEQRKPLTNGEIYTAYITATNQTLRPQDERLALAFARALEQAHNIKEGT